MSLEAALDEGETEQLDEGLPANLGGLEGPIQAAAAAGQQQLQDGQQSGGGRGPNLVDADYIRPSGDCFDERDMVI
eukprot:CAMPEP_0119107006 /NCGR_PEP_ID=MMETSP1180-20130426/7895_1 /TAXON_ID=3052 ORGANISM="Chlamydomonas cf sp, Strain CCMP681" /NCGR_SAMPLE_ID=MMETSP1180 /ASSEMBLY_ACC=CAM_ASM_000741 /LENGTH=75 /DNA_ID=CAMNT_0007092427 /DNA_START=25 /DNA_END=252 /DNA_ORIENTATION=-